MKTKAESTVVVAIRESIYNRLVDYRAKNAPAPSIVNVVSVAVTEWLERQEKQE
jgi:hypothetical protein